MYRSIVRYTPRRLDIKRHRQHALRVTGYELVRSIAVFQTGDTLVVLSPFHLYGHSEWRRGYCSDSSGDNNLSANQGQEKDTSGGAAKGLGNASVEEPEHTLSSEGRKEGGETAKKEVASEALPEAAEPNLHDMDKKKVDRKLNSLRAKFKRKLAKRVIPWDKISDSFENFPYHLNEHTRDLLVESAAAQLWHPGQTKFGKVLRTSSHLVLLNGPPGTEIYQEKLVRALVHHLQTSLLILDSELLASQHFKEESSFAELETEQDTTKNQSIASSMLKQMMTSGTVNMEDATDEEGSSNEKCIGCFDKIVETFEQLVNLQQGVPQAKSALQMEKDVEDEDSEEHYQEPTNHAGINLGDRVRYIGCNDEQCAKRRSLPRIGQQGLVTSISNGSEKIGVKFEMVSSKGKKNNSSVIVCEAKELEKVDANCCEKEPWMSIIEAFTEFAAASTGVIVFFPDMQRWLANAVPPDERNLFIHTLGDHLNKSKGAAVFIAGRVKEPETHTHNGGPFDTLKSFLFSMRGPGFRRVRVQRNEKEDDMKGMDEMYDLFKNIIPIVQPQEPEMFREWKEQLHQDRKRVLMKSNKKEILKVLSENAMKCLDLLEVGVSDMQLSEKQAQKIVGWARNICLSEGLAYQKGRYLYLPAHCLDKAVVRFIAVEKNTQDKVNDLKILAENDYEHELLASVVRPKEIGVSFDQIGALEDVKNTLKELIILPLKRPELFKKGNLRKPCKGVLLFGPPGTGKTLLAKAVATEAGANFMSINSSNITSKWFGDAEKLARSLFTVARKLEPAIIFIDEVDGLLRARGDASEHEASRRVRNELMAAWDGLQSKDSERIIVLATTNRPFDLDDAVIRRLPRRIFVDLPDAQNREKILHVLLADEELVDQFSFQELASETEGFSGSDLKNLCVAAAYRPIREFLEAEKLESGTPDQSTVRQKDIQVNLRPLCLDDFLQAKSKVGLSVSYDANSMVEIRKWNEQYGEGGNRAKSVFGFIK